MAKIQEYETVTNIVCHYTKKDIQSIGELSRWLFAATSMNEFTIKKILLINTENKDFGTSTEIRIADICFNLSKYICDTRADFICVCLQYSETNMVIGINLNDWTCSISTNKENVAKIQQVVQLLKLEH